MRKRTPGSSGARILAALAVLLLPGAALALSSPTETIEYMLIGTGDADDIGTAVAISNSEIGANSFAAPGPGLVGSVPPLPAGTAPVFVGISGDGDVAVTDTGGNFDYSNIEFWGSVGTECTGTTGSCNDGVSNTNYNGAPMTTSNGITGGVDHSGLIGELLDYKTDLPAAVGDNPDIVLDFSADGKWDTNLTINLLSGLTVIDIDTGGNDLTLTNANLVFDGPSDAFVLIRVPDDANFLVNQSNILIGDGGIGFNNVLFYSLKGDNNQHFNINDAVINGIAFWDLGMAGGEITFNNVQGCTQLIADKINLNDVRLTSCVAGVNMAPIPEPATGSLVALGALALALRGRARRS